jgi:hypothetical protein
MLHQVIRRAYYLNKHLEAPLLKEAFARGHDHIFDIGDKLTFDDPLVVFF